MMKVSMHQHQHQHQHQRKRKHGVWRTALGVLAAFFGVQSDRNRKSDFANGSPAMFIAIGLVMTILLVVAIYLLVRLTMAYAGA